MWGRGGRRADAALPAVPVDPRAPRDVAVVDVGSNSVRLVILRLEGRAIWTVFNEKVLAGLGRGLAGSGRLNPEGVTAALAALRRFRAVLDAAQPDRIYTAATAAVREAHDGPDFAERVRTETGLELRVLSGEDEARYAALGVVAGDPSAVGVVGDLGGSSLELTRVGGGVVGQGVTLPLGPFALGAGGPFDAARVRAAVARTLAPISDAYATPTFHAVGGAWRNLALLHMRMTAYPLAVVHQYALSGREALDAARFVARQSKGSLERIEGVSKKRLETLPCAALVLEGVVERLGIERVVISAYGVREGLLFDAMPAEIRAEDPLVAGCEALGLRLGVADGLGAALQRWLAPAFEGLEPVLAGDRDRVLLAATAHLADTGARLHPDHRADLVFDQVLRAPLAGWNHRERAFVAVAAYARYSSADAAPAPEITARLLTPDQLRRARALGAALRLGADLSGRSPPLLDKATLTLDHRYARLTADPAWADLLLGEQTRKRLNALAQALDLDFTIGS